MEEGKPTQKNISAQEDTAPKTVYKVVKREIKEKYSPFELLGYFFWVSLSLISVLVAVSYLEELKAVPYFIGYLILIVLSYLILTNGFSFIKGSLSMPQLPVKITLVVIFSCSLFLILVFRQEIISFVIANFGFLFIRIQ